MSGATNPNQECNWLQKSLVDAFFTEWLMVIYHSRRVAQQTQRHNIKLNKLRKRAQNIRKDSERNGMEKQRDNREKVKGGEFKQRPR